MSAVPVTEPPPALPQVEDCAHCGLPVPPDLRSAEGEQFCCAGCRAVYAVLQDRGLQGYYDLARRLDAPRRPATTTQRAYAELDASTFLEAHTHIDGEVRVTELYLEGVHCGACVWLVERLPRLLPGVRSARVDLRRSRVELRWDPAQVQLSDVARELDALGYPPHPVAGDLEAARQGEERRFLVQLAVAGFLAGNVMLMAFALYGGDLFGMAPEHRQLFRWVCLGLTIPAVLGPGRVFLRGAWAALRAGTLHMDLPISLGLVAGLSWGTFNTVRGTGDVYFDTVAVLVFLLLVGRWLQRRQQRRAVDATDLLRSIQPHTARVLRDGVAQEVLLSEVAPGHVLEVRADEAIPADGVVVSGSSHLDLSLLTGESRPIAVEPGARVNAGTLNRSSPLQIRVELTGEETRLGLLLREVEACTRRKAPVVLLADRIAGVFVACVLVLAAATAAIWAWLDPAHAVDHAVALLIVTCPCALGLATPLALSVALGRAAKRGVLVKGGHVIELLARPGRIWLDKTGTLTEGRTRLVDWRGPDWARPLVLGLESSSAHPFAQGFREAFDGSSPAPCQQAQRIGAGLTGQVDGRRVEVGAPAWVGPRLEASPPEWCQKAVREALFNGHSPLWVAVDGRLEAVAAFGDPLRPDALQALTRLRALGWEPGILSGDHPDVVAAVAARLGVTDHEGGLTPEDKLQRVEASLREGPVLMVGDGVNDAAALAAATVGVGVHGGAEAALAAADVFLTRPDLGAVVELLEGSATTLTTIRRNMALSLAYNLTGASLAMLGWVSPLVAAVLMPLSSLSVVASSSRAWRTR